jgi:ribosomal protein L22
MADDEKQDAEGEAPAEEKPKRARRKKADAPEAAASEAPAEEKPKRARRKPAAKKDEAEAAAAEAPAEEKPKRAPRKPAAKKAEAEEVKREDAAKEAEAEEAEVAGEPEPEDEKARPKPAARRRGGEATAGRATRAARPRRNAAPDVTVRARAKYVRCAPRKARLVIDHIRGKRVDEARAILLHTQRAASRDVLKLLESAIANAENNHELVADELRVARAYVDEGPTLKRYRPRALGRATRIRKRTSHLTIELAAKE